MKSRCVGIYFRGTFRESRKGDACVRRTKAAILFALRERSGIHGKARRACENSHMSEDSYYCLSKIKPQRSAWQKQMTQITTPDSKRACKNRTQTHLLPSRYMESCVRANPTYLQHYVYHITTLLFPASRQDKTSSLLP